MKKPKPREILYANDKKLVDEAIAYEQRPHKRKKKSKRAKSKSKTRNSNT